MRGYSTDRGLIIGAVFMGRTTSVVRRVTAVTVLSVIALFGRIALAQTECGQNSCQNGECVFSGLIHKAVGEVVLRINEDCHLVVSNIGSSGQDGVDIPDVPPQSSLVFLSFDKPNLSRWGDGGMAELELHGANAFGPPVHIGMLSIKAATDPSSALALVIDPALAPQSYEYDVLLAGQPVLPAPMVFNEPVPVMLGKPVDFEAIGAQIVPSTLAAGGATGGVGVRVDFADPTSIQVDGAEPVAGDGVRIRALGLSVQVPSLAGVGLRAADTNPMIIRFEYAGSTGTGRCLDQDRDGYGANGDPSCPNGPEPDCDDTRDDVYPNAPERCDFVDNDCDGRIDEDFDRDRDGFSTCNRDCDDDDPLVNPQMPERCNGKDDNCNGSVDEGYGVQGVDPNTHELTTLPIGSVCVVGAGECEVVGVVACTPDGLAAYCDGEPLPGGTEGPTGAQDCFDFLDNDCDGLIDHEDPDCTGPELCDGFDNDNNGEIDEDFPGLGAPCAVGLGLCRAQGKFVCNQAGDGIVCNAQPNDPRPESPPGSRACTDGLDNDCDRLVDLNDPDCREPEKCDGKDNDGDHLIDEDFANVLGQACTAGIGDCRRFGVKVCDFDGGVKCNAVPAPGGYEGPGDCSCSDGLDNDCDLLVDKDDPDCTSDALLPYCQLYECRPKVGDDCYSGHRIEFGSNGIGPDGDVKAELWALDLNDEIVKTIPVENGDLALLRSDINGVATSTADIPLDLNTFTKWVSCATGPENPTYPEACEIFDGDCDADVDLRDFAVWQRSFGTVQTTHRVRAPAILLHVEADNGFQNTHAFCSNMPYLKVLEPQGTVVSESEGDITRVLAAAPNVDPHSIRIRVDGVDILPWIAVNPAVDFPGGPYQGQFPLIDQNGARIGFAEVCDLYVRSGEPGQNTVFMILKNLGCGGHLIVVTGKKVPGSYPDPAEATCHVDDLTDRGISHGLGIKLRDPKEGDVIIVPPVVVQGEACHGRKIEDVLIAGSSVGVGSQYMTPGDGINYADTFHVPFEHTVAVNDLRAEADGAPPVQGRLDPGANTLIVQAVDGSFNSTVKERHIAVGPIVEIPPFAVAEFSDELGNVAANIAAVEVTNAFTLALDKNALTQFFSELCNEVGPDIAAKLEERLVGYESPGKTVSAPWPLCDPKNVRLKVNSIDIDPNGFACEITPLADKLRLKITLPSFTASTRVRGGCKETCCFGICVVRVTVDTYADWTVPEVSVTFEVTESSILNQTLMDDFAFDPGPDPIVVNGSIDDHSDVGCIVGAVLDVLNFFLEVVSLGFWDPGIGDVEFELTGDDIKEKIGEDGGDMREVEVFTFENEDLVPQFETHLTHKLADVQITPNGLAAAIEATFEAVSIDPNVPGFPGTPLTPAPLPQPPIGGANEVTVGISDDVFNQLFASLTQTGGLSTLFEEVRVLGDFLPDPSICSTLSTLIEPRCVGITGGDCNQFVLASRRETCEETKQKWEDRLLTPGTAIIVHGGVNVPPKLYIDDDPATTTKVEVLMRYSQVEIALIADRDGDGVLSQPMANLPGCFGATTSTVTECVLWAACLNVNVTAGLFLPADELLLRMSVLDVSHELSTGTMCGGGQDDLETDLIEGAASSDTLDLLNQKLREGTPDLKASGLDFGGLVSFQNAKLIAIENNGDPEFQDYIAITGKLVVSP